MAAWRTGVSRIIERRQQRFRGECDTCGMKYPTHSLSIVRAGILVAASAIFSFSAWAVDAPAVLPSANGVLTGVILEVKDVEAYTYLRIKTQSGETWAAVNRTPLKKGAKVSIGDAMVMQNFESKALKRTFSSIVFGNLMDGKAGATPAATAAGAHSGAPVAAKSTDPIRVDKATGANAYTVAEVIGKSAELKDKSVRVRAKVVKFNPEIMGKNWLHLQDGSGSVAANTHDILVTTKAGVKVGDVVTMTGIVRVDKDFGAGYVYKVMVEDATIQP